ncbi:MAG TPA: hypothetical protein VHZ95_12670 [Polyangiales bacterium]|nr:hypothetical protein [Polyangiales bacterium]
MTEDDRDLTARSRALIDAARASDDPSSRDRSRVLAKLTAAIGAGATLSAVSEAAAAEGGVASTSIATGLGLKSIGWMVALTLTAAGSGTVWLQHSRVAERPAVAAAVPAARRPDPPVTSAPIEIAMQAPTPPIETAPAPRPRVLRSTASPKTFRSLQPSASAAVSTSSAQSTLELTTPSPPTAAEPIAPTSTPNDRAEASDRPSAPVQAISVAPTTPAPPPSAASLGAELALLGAAQRALADGQFARALSTLDRHAARYPNGSLSEERTAARAAVLCRMDRQSEGQRELARLATRAPNSPLLFWARRYCRPERQP